MPHSNFAHVANDGRRVKRPYIPTLGVVYGQPDRFSTSYQTTQLVRALSNWLSPTLLRIPSRGKSKIRRSIQRVANNFLWPMLTRPMWDYVLYANDGAADLRHWRGQRVLYWYDAPWDYARQKPTRRQWVHHLRYRNLITADYVFAVSQLQTRVAKALRPGRESTVHYLPVGVDCEFFDPASPATDAAAVRRQFGLPAKTIVGYLGYIASFRGRFAGEPLVEVAPQLVREYGVHFLVVGFGPALDLFKHRVAAANLTEHFTFTGFVLDEQLPSCLAAMDICIDTLEEGFHSEARSETKLKQYMAMGRACVATAIGENVVDLDAGRCGVLVPPGSAGLQEGIASLCRRAELRESLGNAARARSIDVYSWSKLAERLAEALGLNVDVPTPTMSTRHRTP